METRICGICKIEFPKTEEFFAKRKGVRKERFQGNCRCCQKEYRKKHYEENKEKYLTLSKEHKKETIKWFINYKSTLSCSNCGESRYWTLDFHHTNSEEKEYNISILANSSSKKKLIKEMSKCIILCANCHRDLHYREKMGN